MYSKVIARHESSCCRLCLHQEQPYIVLSCGEDGVVKNIDLRESTLIHEQYNKYKVFI